jgi:phosphoribosylglycinamide formyltransferase-1
MPGARLAILISGRGSNMEAILQACAAPDYPAQAALVLSDRADAKGLETARAAGVTAEHITHPGPKGRAAFEAVLTARLKTAQTDLICLAGFMRMLSPAFVEEWRDLILNIHPSLLPAFPGLDTHRRALEAGVKLHGCSVHYVRAGMDDGPIVGQAAVPVLPGDSEDSLAARVLAAEHLLYPACIRMVVEGRAPVRDGVAVLESPVAAPAPLFMPPL